MRESLAGCFSLAVPHGLLLYVELPGRIFSCVCASTRRKQKDVC